MQKYKELLRLSVKLRDVWYLGGEKQKTQELDTEKFVLDRKCGMDCCHEIHCGYKIVAAMPNFEKMQRKIKRSNL